MPRLRELADELLQRGRLRRLRPDHRLPPVDGRLSRGRGARPSRVISLGHRRGLPRRRRQDHRQDAARGHGHPDQGGQRPGLKATRQVLNMLDEQQICDDNAPSGGKTDLIRREVDCISMKAVRAAAGGDLDQGRRPRPSRPASSTCPSRPPSTTGARSCPCATTKAPSASSLKGEPAPRRGPQGRSTASASRSGRRPKGGPSPSRWSPTTSTPSAKDNSWGDRDNDTKSQKALFAAGAGLLLRRPARHQGGRPPRRLLLRRQADHRRVSGRSARPARASRSCCSWTTGRWPWRLRRHPVLRRGRARPARSSPAVTSRSSKSTSGPLLEDAEIGTFRRHDAKSSERPSSDGQPPPHRHPLRRLAGPAGRPGQTRCHTSRCRGRSAKSTACRSSLEPVPIFGQTGDDRYTTSTR